MLRDQQAQASLATVLEDEDGLDPRRMAQRCAVHAVVESVAPPGASGVVLNVSVGGLRIALDRALPVGEVCLLRVEHEPGNVTLEHARVVWVKLKADGCVVGLEFVSAH